MNSKRASGRLDRQARRRAKAKLVAVVALLFTGCATYHPEPPRTEPGGPPSLPRGVCQPYWDALETSLRENESLDADSVMGDDEMADALDNVTNSPEFEALLGCLSGSDVPVRE